MRLRHLASTSCPRILLPTPGEESSARSIISNANQPIQSHVPNHLSCGLLTLRATVPVLLPRGRVPEKQRQSLCPRAPASIHASPAQGRAPCSARSFPWNPRQRLPLSPHGPWGFPVGSSTHSVPLLLGTVSKKTVFEMAADLLHCYTSNFP